MRTKEILAKVHAKPAFEHSWVAALPENQRTAVNAVFPLIETIVRDTNPVCAGNIMIQVFESQLANPSKPKPMSGHALAMLRGRVAREELKLAEGGSFSAADAGAKLGISKTAVLERYRLGRILGWREARQNSVRFPLWQFTDDNILPGLSGVLAVLNRASWMDDWARVLFFLNPRDSLDNQRPLDLLRLGETEKVIRLAQTTIE